MNATQIRIFLSACLLTIVLFLGSAFISNQGAAIAAPLTPEAAKYEIDQASSPDEAKANLEQRAKSYKKELRENSNYTKKAATAATENTKNALERAADNVREKLNLDEPLPQSTKDFLNDVKP